MTVWKVDEKHVACVDPVLVFARRYKAQNRSGCCFSSADIRTQKSICWSQRVCSHLKKRDEKLLLMLVVNTGTACDRYRKKHFSAQKVHARVSCVEVSVSRERRVFMCA